MTNAQRLALLLSEIRQKLNQLSGKDELTEAETEELRSSARSIRSSKNGTVRR